MDDHNDLYRTDTGQILISFLASEKRNITTNTEEIDLLLHGYLTSEPIYQNDPVITKYLLEQYGRMESSAGYTIEQIMPQNRKPYWQMVSKTVFFPQGKLYIF